MKYVMLTIERCNDCPLVEHVESSETRCTVQENKIVHSESIDAGCPLPDAEDLPEDRQG